MIKIKVRWEIYLFFQPHFIYTKCR